MSMGEPSKGVTVRIHGTVLVTNTHMKEINMWLGVDINHSASIGLYVLNSVPYFCYYLRC